MDVHGGRPPDSPGRSDAPIAFTLDADVLPTLVANLAAEQAVLPEVLTLADLRGEWLHEQLAELLQQAQREPHRVIIGPRLQGADVSIDAYTDADGLILALRYDPLFFRYGARITGGWDEPSAFIPLNEDRRDLDLANVGAIIGLLVERANALLPVLRAGAAL